MYSKIIGFELKYRYSKWMTYIFMAMMIFQAAWYAKGSFEYYVNDLTNFNAAGIIYQSLSGGGMLMIIAIAVITGTALFKDIEFKTAESFYSYPVSDKTWFLGKFTAAYIVNLSICLSYTLGFAILQYTGIAEPDRFGPVPWGQLFHAFLIFSVPNMFIVTAIALSLVVFFRSMAASYMGIFMTTMLFLVAESTRENPAFIMANYMIDPFCFTHTRDTIEALPVALKNYAYFKLDSIYWANRILWVSMTGILLFFATKKFSFSYFLAKPVKKKKPTEDNSEASFSYGSTITAAKEFGIWENIKKLGRLSLLELKNTIRPVGFKITFGVLVLMFMGYNLLWNAEYYIHTDTLPITSAMTYTRLPNGVFILILLAVFAGELLFKERSSNMWQLTDVLPVPTWVNYISKYIAMAGVAMLFALALFIPGLLAQILQGFYDFELSVYFNDLFSYHFGWITYLIAIALAFFVGSIFAQRFVAHIITVAILLFIIVMADIGVIEQVRLMFPFTPGVEDYSEMAGYGTYGDAARSYNLMWIALSTAMVITGIWFWNRGSMQPLYKRISLKKTQLHFAGKIAIVLLLGVFFYMQRQVVASDHKHGNFKLEAVQDAEDAEYEMLFKYIEEQNQLKVCGTDLIIDIFPDIRKADYSFTMLLTNVGNSAIDSLHISLKDFVKLHHIQLSSGEVTEAWKNEKHNQMAYYLPDAINAGDTVKLTGECTFQYFGYSSVDAQEALVYNGCFIQEDILPYIGYNADKELDQNRTRSDERLEKLASRMDPTDDISSLQNNTLSPNAIMHNTSIKVRTNNGQSVLATGAIQADETIDGKTYSVFETELPAAMKWQIAVGNYNDYIASVGNNVALNIKYDERHAYNLAHMKDALDKGIAFLSDNLGDYPYSEVHLVEIPFYNDEDIYATPNQIAISEKHCWTADGSREKDLSYIYYTMCREIVAQWILQNIQVADVQGADMILKALPEAYALFYLQQQFGDEVLQLYIEKKTDRYGKGRGNESNSEPPLIYADGTDYLEVNKGALELLKVIQELGIKTVSQELKMYVNNASGKPIVFKGYYTNLKKMYPSDKRAELASAFEEVKEQ